MAQPSTRKSLVSKARHVLASCLLAALLVQISMFFVGLLVPVRRIELLWGKSFEDRQMAVCQPARVLTQFADQFPINAKIYITDPQLLLHWNAVYFFYPRLVTVTMTNGGYRTHEAYAAWNEWPTDDWLLSNGFTHVLDFKNNALKVRQLQPAPSSSK